MVWTYFGLWTFWTFRNDGKRLQDQWKLGGNIELQLFILLVTPHKSRMAAPQQAAMVPHLLNVANKAAPSCVWRCPNLPLGGNHECQHLGLLSSSAKQTAGCFSRPHLPRCRASKGTSDCELCGVLIPINVAAWIRCFWKSGFVPMVGLHWYGADPWGQSRGPVAPWRLHSPRSRRGGGVEVAVMTGLGRPSRSEDVTWSGI